MFFRETSAVSVTTASFPERVIHSTVPVLAVFEEPRSGAALQMAPVIGELAEHYGERLRVARVNAGESPELLNAFGIRGLPAMILFQNGYPLEMRNGPQALSLSALREWIDTLIFQEAVSG